MARDLRTLMMIVPDTSPLAMARRELPKRFDDPELDRKYIFHSDEQVEEIKKGLEAGLDVSLFDDVHHNAEYMRLLREDLALGRPIHLYMKAVPAVINFHHSGRDALIHFPEFAKYIEDGYSNRQLMDIFEGMVKGLDISKYDDEKYNGYQMEQIKLGLKKGIDISLYNDPEYGSDQMEQIRRGLEAGLNVSCYANPDYYTKQMSEIRKGLEAGLNVSIYTDPEFENEQMREIRLGLMSGVNVSAYANKALEWKQMREIRLGLEQGLNTALFSPDVFTGEQMREIREGLVSGIDVGMYSYPEIKATRMHKMRLGLEQGKSLDEIAPDTMEGYDKVMKYVDDKAANPPKSDNGAEDAIEKIQAANKSMQNK